MDPKNDKKVINTDTASGMGLLQEVAIGDLLATEQLKETAINNPKERNGD